MLNAKYSRDNPMQTMLHNDENQTGGGIPVTAFWTGAVGEAIGHAETVPLKLSMPVKTQADQRVSAFIALDGAHDAASGRNVRVAAHLSYRVPWRFLRTSKHLFEDFCRSVG